MTPKESSRHLQAALEHLRDGDAIPPELASQLRNAWEDSGDPRLMLSVAAYVVSQQELVLVAAKIARIAVQAVQETMTNPLSPHELETVRRGILTAEAWADGRASMRDVDNATGDLIYGVRQSAEIPVSTALSIVQADSARDASWRVSMFISRAEAAMLHSREYDNYSRYADTYIARHVGPRFADVIRHSIQVPW
jgi:hypothetical protein